MRGVVLEELPGNQVYPMERLRRPCRETAALGQFRAWKFVQSAGQQQFLAWRFATSPCPQQVRFNRHEHRATREIPSELLHLTQRLICDAPLEFTDHG